MTSKVDVSCWHSIKALLDASMPASMKSFFAAPAIATASCELRELGPVWSRIASKPNSRRFLPKVSRASWPPEELSTVSFRGFPSASAACAVTDARYPIKSASLRIAGCADEGQPVAGWVADRHFAAAPRLVFDA